MIISHTHRFIFIKSLKTAGTSIEAALSQYCSGDDVVTELGDYRFNRDANGNWIHHAMNASGFEQHDDAMTIKRKVSESVWNDYLRFSITRNPWDRTVSLFFWERKRKPETKKAPGLLQRLGFGPDEQAQLRKEFRDFILSGLWENNDRFYFENGELCVDLVLRYETIQEDFERLSHRLGLPPTRLPMLKAGIRKDKAHYSTLYDDETRRLVADRHRLDIEHFGYTFEQAKSSLHPR